MYTNIDGLPNKKAELLQKIDELNPDIISITETKPKNLATFHMAEYSIPGYDIFHNDRHKRGVALYVKS